ncbi:MAG TPA: hypothetical protein VJC00_02810 [Candidatus Nanoarchaeia archaeon]|nr:hypothetical protein [Candidatus Nanoarchaeia archaeon]
MRVVNLVLFSALALVITAFAAVAQDNTSRDFELDFYSEYCNCDSDCGEFSSCLTDDTDPFIRNMNIKTGQKLEEAKEAGYKGMCTAVTLDGELMVYGMTKNCTAAEGAQEEPAEAEKAEPEGTITQTKTLSRVITVEFEDTPKTAGKTSTKTNAKKTTAGGSNMDIITAGIISGTIVLVGFFGLMAWIAYLLQNKAEDKAKKQ